MTNTLAIIIGGAILLFLGSDYMFFDGSNTLFLARKLYWLIDYIAFWR